MCDETESKIKMSQYTQYYSMVSCWKILFCGIHCFMISICDAESQFNYGTNESYHLLIHHTELEQLGI